MNLSLASSTFTWEDIRDIEKTRAKAEVKAVTRLQERQIRYQMKETEEERKRQQGEELVFGEDGELQLVTTNLSIETIPRRLTNMRKLKLTVLRHAEDSDDRIFRIDFKIGERNDQVYLESREVGNGSYLVKKFASQGAYFMLKSARAKEIAVKILCSLQQMSEDEEILPDEMGWIKMQDGMWHYIGEEEMTWKRAKKLAKYAI